MMKYSVVIPAYNAEKTIERCLDSLLKQNRDDVQLVVVNDGSKDSTGSILDKYEAEYDCITRIDQENGGVSTARNRGIAEATGEYITFVDSDDYVLDGYFSCLDQAGDADVLMFGSENAWDYEDENEVLKKIAASSDFLDKLSIALSSRKIMPPWNKRYMTEIIRKNKIQFNTAFSIGEDFAFCLEYILHCETFDAVEDVLVSIDVSDQQSLSRKYRKDIADSMTGVYRSVERSIINSRFFPEEKNQLLKIADYLYVRNVCTAVAENFKIKKPSYFRDRSDLIAINRKFKRRIGGNGYCGSVHRMLRMFVKYEMILPIYLVTKKVKYEKN